MPDNWPLNPDAAGKWYRLIHRHEWVSGDLLDLQERLYNFGVDDGHFETTLEVNCSPIETDLASILNAEGS